MLLRGVDACAFFAQPVDRRRGGASRLVQPPLKSTLNTFASQPEFAVRMVRDISPDFMT
jgi:hypothetical protein